MRDVSFSCHGDSSHRGDGAKILGAVVFGGLHVLTHNQSIGPRSLNSREVNAQLASQGFRRWSGLYQRGGCRGDRFVVFFLSIGDNCDRLERSGDGALLYQRLPQIAIDKRLDIHVDFVGFDCQQRLAAQHLFARQLPPLKHLGLARGLSEIRQHDYVAHKRDRRRQAYERCLFKSFK